MYEDMPGLEDDSSGEDEMVPMSEKSANEVIRVSYAGKDYSLEELGTKAAEALRGGNVKEAVEMSSKILQAAKVKWGEKDLNYARCGVTYLQMVSEGKSESITENDIELAKRILAAFKQRQDLRADEVVYAHFLLGELLLATNKRKEGEDFLRNALQLLEREPILKRCQLPKEQEHDLVAVRAACNLARSIPLACCNLALLSTAQYFQAPAERRDPQLLVSITNHYNLALAFARSKALQDVTVLLLVLQRFGQLMLSVAKLDEAESLLREADALIMGIRKDGKRPSGRHFTSFAQREYSVLLMRRNKKVEAEAALSRALETSAWCNDGDLAELSVRMMLVLVPQRKHNEMVLVAEKMLAQPGNATRAQLFQARYYHAIASAALNC